MYLESLNKEELLGLEKKAVRKLYESGNDRDLFLFACSCRKDTTLEPDVTVISSSLRNTAAFLVAGCFVATTMVSALARNNDIRVLRIGHSRPLRLLHVGF